MRLFDTNSNITPTDFEAAQLHGVLSSARFAEALPSQLRRLVSFSDVPLDDTPEIHIAYASVSTFAINYTAALGTFTGLHKDAISRSARHRRHLQPLLDSCLNFRVFADLLGACGDFLDAAMSSRLPQSNFADEIPMYAKSLADSVKYFHVEDTEVYVNDLSVAMSSGTWARPLFAAIERVVVRYQTEAHDEENNADRACARLLLLSNILGNAFRVVDTESHYWNICSKSAEALADPTFHKYALGVLGRVSEFLKDLPEQPHKIFLALGLPMYGYIMLLQATYGHGMEHEGQVRWAQIAEDIIKLGDLWLYFAKAPANTISLFIPIFSDKIQIILSSLEVQLDNEMGTVPVDAVFPVLQAVERLVTMAAATSQFAAAAPSANLDLPTVPVLYLAIDLAEACSSYSGAIFIPELQWKNKVGHAALEAIQSVSKAVVLIKEMEVTQRRRFLPVPDTERDMPRANNDSWWVRSLTNVLDPLLEIVYYIADTADIGSGERTEESQIQAACAVLTMAETLRTLGSSLSANVSDESTFVDSSIMTGQVAGILAGCGLPSDEAGLRQIGQHLSEDDEDDEELIDRLTSLCDELKTVNAKDCERLKLRTRVLNQRLCGWLQCTNLRPSLNSRFGKLCAGCKSIRYCCLEHQKADWKMHKRVCKALQEEV